MDLESLRCFDAVATTLNFRAAARRVHLSPTAFSDRIRRLESDLGRDLLRRTTRRVELTDAGQNLLPLAREVLGGVERLRVAAAGADHAPPFDLFVGTRYELGLSWICPALTPLSRERPERRIHLYFGDSPDLVSRLERGDLDAIVASVRLTGPKLSYAALHPEKYAFVARRGLRIAGPEDARASTLVDVSRDLPLFRYFLDALPDGAPWPFASIEYMGGIGAIRARVLEGGRAAVLPLYFVQADLTARRLVRLMPEVPLASDAFRLVWRTGHVRETALLELASSLRRRPLR